MKLKVSKKMTVDVRKGDSPDIRDIINEIKLAIDHSATFYNSSLDNVTTHQRAFSITVTGVIDDDQLL